MKADEDKLLEKLVDKIMKDSALETPSFDFTTKVMSQVVTTKTDRVYAYKKIIPKLVFIILSGCFISVFVYIWLSGKTPTNNSFSHLDVSKLFDNSRFSLFNFSKITIYSVVVATLMFLVQISFLKKHFDNQLEK